MVQNMTYPIMTDEEAARLIKNNDTIGIGGFSSVGVPKVVPAALARYAIDEHEAGRAFQVGLVRVEPQVHLSTPI